MAAGIGLVGDVGRHSVRFALANLAGDAAPHDIRRFDTDQHSTFTGALLAYLDEVGLRDARLPSALAIAGAVHGDLINLTGSRWFISVGGVGAVLGEVPGALNECAANALALTNLPAAAFASLPGPRALPPQVTKRYAVIGVGTGLGTAALVGDGVKLQAIDGEAGHMRFSPCTGEEARFEAWCTEQGIRAERETLVSAPGLSAAYAALSPAGTPRIDSKEVTRRAPNDPVARAAVEMCAQALWGYASDIALAFGAWDGVYLMGALARALRPALATAAGRARFEAAGAFRRRLAAIPVSVVEVRDLELIGAAVAMRNRSGAVLRSQ
jgi:glucokinase